MLVRKEKGFTLIELMVVVLIIGILVAIAVPVFNVARENAWRRTCQANLRTLDGAIQAYYAEYGAFSADFNDGTNIDSNHDLVEGQYIKKAPTCPKAAANGIQTVYDIQSVMGSLPEAQCPSVDAGGAYSGHSY